MRGFCRAGALLAGRLLELSEVHWVVLKFVVRIPVLLLRSLI